MLVAQLVPLAATVAAAGAEGGQEEAWGSLVAHDLQRPKKPYIHRARTTPPPIYILKLTAVTPHGKKRCSCGLL